MINETLGEQSSLVSFFASRSPTWWRQSQNELAPPAAGVDPNPDELVYGPLTPLEATNLVHGPLRVNPEGPGQKYPEPKNFVVFAPSSDQLIASSWWSAWRSYCPYAMLRTNHHNTAATLHNKSLSTPWWTNNEMSSAGEKTEVPTPLFSLFFLFISSFSSLSFFPFSPHSRLCLFFPPLLHSLQFSHLPPFFHLHAPSLCLLPVPNAWYILPKLSLLLEFLPSTLHPPDINTKDDTAFPTSTQKPTSTFCALLIVHTKDDTISTIYTY